MKLVGWVQDDGDEYHDFQYATVRECRMMERGERPIWRERHTPVYDIEDRSGQVTEVTSRVEAVAAAVGGKPPPGGWTGRPSDGNAVNPE